MEMELEDHLHSDVIPGILEEFSAEIAVEIAKEIG